MKKMDEIDLKIFPNEEFFQKIYSKYLENEPSASKAVRDSYKGMHNYFEEYLVAIQEDMFRYAYKCGYLDGRREAMG
ncbi:MAG: hypothetical protein LUE87_06340 [Lachnospiraceae bacterium]|nr:hypothetical protein [Lachnospiraceae bacterium]